MPPTPTKSRKSKSFFEQDKYTAELTSGQLVIGVTILLVFGLVCFMLGVIVGKFQPTTPQVAGQPPQQQVAQQPVPQQQQTAPPQMDVPAAASPAEREPERLSTGPVAVSPGPSVNQRQQAPAQAPSEQSVDQPRIVPFPEPDEETIAPLPTVDDAAPIEIQPPVQSGAESEPEEERAVTLDEPLQVAEAEPVEEAPFEETAADTPPADEPPALEPEEPTVQAPPTAGGIYTVQVAALSNRARAENLQRQIESNTDYEVMLTPSPNGTLVMVQVGRYADRASAGRVRAEMRERYGYSDSFITPIR